MMWPAGPRCAIVRTVRLRLHRSVRHSRRYVHNAPPKTYFQPISQPPPPVPRAPFRILRWTLFGVTAFGIGFYVHAYLSAKFMLDELLAGGQTVGPEELAVIQSGLQAAVEETRAKMVHPLTYEQASEVLRTRAGLAITPTTVSHVCQTPSNLPCEDTWSSGTYMYFNDPAKDWSEWAIFDGHAGLRTSQALKELLPVIVGEKLWEAGCMQRMYVPNDQRTLRTIQNAFKYMDEAVLGEAESCLRDGGWRPADTISLISNMLSGSCALMALFDPAKGVLRVANTGDSRAVLGRWEDGKYVAVPMSTDHTGFNASEVERLAREHPGEDCIDPKTGRIFGLAVTRAFGDSRWKWTEELTRKAHEMFWGPAPRPNGVIKTPPYLTAEPEVSEVKVQTGEHADFLIMASDGLWDLMSNEHAVECVQLWLQHNSPLDLMRRLREDVDENVHSRVLASTGTGGDASDQQQQPSLKSRLGALIPKIASTEPILGTPPPPPDETEDADPDTYFDAAEGVLKWRVSPKHFVCEDDNVGAHLIKNAFGGSRRRLFESVMTVQPPLSRKVRDDVTVHVIFFGVDARETASELAREAAGLSQQQPERGR